MKIEIHVVERKPDPWECPDQSSAEVAETPRRLGPDKKIGPFVVIVDGERSTGELAFDEMLGTVVKLALGRTDTYQLLTREQLREREQRQIERAIDVARGEANERADRHMQEYFP